MYALNVAGSASVMGTGIMANASNAFIWAAAVVSLYE